MKFDPVMVGFSALLVLSILAILAGIIGQMVGAQ